MTTIIGTGEVGALHSREELEEMQRLPLQRKIQITTAFKVSSRCCTIMKKQPMKKYSKETGRVPIIATMANESRSRRATWLRMGCNAFSGKKPSSQPMSFWTEEDVLEYLYTYQVPYASVYGEIVRTDRGGGRRQAKSVLAVSFVPLALTLKKLQTVSSV